MNAYTQSVVIITVGIAWLLNTLGVVPQVNWLWTLGLFAGGIILIVVFGLDKGTFTFGSFLIICSLTSVIRQTGRMTLNTELPILVISFGVLLGLSHMFGFKEASNGIKKSEDQ